MTVKRIRTRRGILHTASLTAVVTLVGEQSIDNSTAADQIENHLRPNWMMETSSTNSVGCVKTSITKPRLPNESTVIADIFTRPRLLDVENLSEAELAGCGLPSRAATRGLPRSSDEYRRWLSSVRDRLQARQLIPWEPASLPKNYPPVPTPAPLHPGPPKPHIEHHVSNEGFNSVLPGSSGYMESPYNSYAGREILDNNYIDNGQAAAPVIQGNYVVAPSYRLPPAAPPGDSVATQISEWIGYADVEDSGTGGSSLAQIGINDNVYTASTGGAFYRLVQPFVEFYPDPVVPLPAMTIMPSDTVSLELVWIGDSSFRYSIMDSNAVGANSLGGTVNLYNTSACASGVTGTGTLITVCNNGDLAEWLLEDHGQYTANTPLQIPPATPVFEKVGLQQPSVTWVDGKIIPNDDTCSECNYTYLQLDLADQDSTGAVLNVTPSWSSNRLHMLYDGPSYPGFAWP